MGEAYESLITTDQAVMIGCCFGGLLGMAVTDV